MERTSSDSGTLDASEVERFSRLAEQWWDESGKFRPLHQIGPVRLQFVRDEAVRHLALAGGGLRPLQGVRLLDVGCGGGLVAEPLARLGAEVMGIDPSPTNIAVAEQHAQGQGLPLAYRATTVEALAAEGAHYDVVVCLEVIEHVPDVAAFVGELSRLVRPGGLLVLSTINRTLKAFALAIVGAEYVLRWLPRGTHRFDRLVRPEELTSALRRAGLTPMSERGMIYDPLRDRWSLGSDMDVNYLMSARK